MALDLLRVLEYALRSRVRLVEAHIEAHVEARVVPEGVLEIA